METNKQTNKQKIMKMKGVSNYSNEHTYNKRKDIFFLKAIGESTPTTGCNKTLRTKKKK
jgi:hypothetical protein